MALNTFLDIADTRRSAPRLAGLWPAGHRLAAAAAACPALQPAEWIIPAQRYFFRV